MSITEPVATSHVSDSEIRSNILANPLSHEDRNLETLRQPSLLDAQSIAQF
jgi:hypothetical protein